MNKGYNLKNYSGKCAAEKKLDFLYELLIKDKNIKLIPTLSKNNKKSIIIQESKGSCSELSL